MFPLLVANKIIPFPTLCLSCAFWLHIHQEVNPVSSNTDPSLAPWNQEFNTRVKGTFHVQKYKASLSPKREFRAKKSVLKTLLLIH